MLNLRIIFTILHRNGSKPVALALTHLMPTTLLLPRQCQLRDLKRHPEFALKFFVFKRLAIFLQALWMSTTLNGTPVAHSCSIHLNTAASGVMCLAGFFLFCILIVDPLGPLRVKVWLRILFLSRFIL